MKKEKSEVEKTVALYGLILEETNLQEEHEQPEEESLLMAPTEEEICLANKLWEGKE